MVANALQQIQFSALYGAVSVASLLFIFLCLWNPILVFWVDSGFGMCAR